MLQPTLKPAGKTEFDPIDPGTAELVEDSLCLTVVCQPLNHIHRNTHDGFLHINCTHQLQEEGNIVLRRELGESTSFLQVFLIIQSHPHVIRRFAGQEGVADHYVP